MRHEWESLSYEMMDCPWDDRERLAEAIAYCENVYEVILDFLAARLNALHQVSFSNRYWRIIVGPWLLYYIHALYDRYTYIKLALKKYRDLDTIVLAKDSYTTPCDFYDFFCKLADDTYNLQIFSHLFDLMGYSFSSRSFSNEKQRHKIINSKRRTKIALKKAYGLALRLMTFEEPVLLCDLHFEQTDIWRLCWASRFKIWPAINEGKYSSGSENVKVNWSCRKALGKVENSDSRDEFITILYKTLAVNFPLSYLEGFENVKRAACRCLKGNIRGVVSSFGWTSNEHFKVLAAEKAEKGAVLCGVQHGGASGINKYTAGDVHVMECSDVYYTWGWRDNKLVKTIPMPDPKMHSLRMASHEKHNVYEKEQAVFIGTMFARYLQYFRFCPQGSQIKRYIEWQVRFFSALPPGLDNKILARLYPEDFGWSNRARLSDFFPKLRFDSHMVPFRDRLQKCKVIVTDNFQTTFLEALALDRPTILFCDLELWKFTDIAQLCINNFHEAGVAYFSPEEAATKLVKVLDNPREWWNSSKVKQARDFFEVRFIMRDEEWVDKWTTELDRRVGLTKSEKS